MGSNWSEMGHLPTCMGVFLVSLPSFGCVFRVLTPIGIPGEEIPSTPRSLGPGIPHICVSFSAVATPLWVFLHWFWHAPRWV